MMTAQESERMAFEKVEIEKLEKFVNETVSAMASTTMLQPNEALDILENIHVEKVSELKGEVDALERDINNETVRRIGSVKLSKEIEKAIAAISAATDLNTEEITAIFSYRPGASLADVSYRLHRQSSHDRESF